MLNNLTLLNFFFEHKEPSVDDFYSKDNKTIISKNTTKINKLMKSNVELLENISAYKIALKSNNKPMQNDTLKEILQLLETPNINCCEFVNYWAVCDMSYSLYNQIFSTKQSKLRFLAQIVTKYIKDRHSLYQTHGYCASTLQVVKDSKSHKTSGNLGIKKVDYLLNTHNFSHFTGTDLNGFIKNDKVYIHPDSGNKKLFADIIKCYKISFKWSKKHQDKLPDYLFKIADKIFVLEHKHIKESGGGQDKQIVELIDLIAQQETNSDVHYVSFLDGVYFNFLSESDAGKPITQRRNIKKWLKKFERNYFVNTAGFLNLLSSLKA